MKKKRQMMGDEEAREMREYDRERKKMCSSYIKVVKYKIPPLAQGKRWIMRIRQVILHVAVRVLHSSAFIIIVI